MSNAAKFIRVGASLQFLLMVIGFVPALGRWMMPAIRRAESLGVGEALRYTILFWIVGAPLAALIVYKWLTPEEKNNGGVLVVFWWMSLIVMIVGVSAGGAAF